MLTDARIQRKAREKEPYLRLLEEADRTGRLGKASYKERANFTIDENILLRLREHCQKTGRKMSTVVEQLIANHLKAASGKK